MIITQKHIDNLRKLEAERTKVDIAVSDKLVEAKRVGGENLVEVERNGEKLQVREKILWQEVFHLGADCQAGEILKKKYPEAFEQAVKQNEVVDNLHNYSNKYFGFDYTQMRLIDLIDLIESLIWKNAWGMFVILLGANVLISIIIKLFWK